MGRGAGGRGGSAAPTVFAALPSFLPGLNFSNCSRRALEKALLDGMGSCLFERMPGLPSKATIFRNVTMEQGKQFTCVFPNVSLAPPTSVCSHWLTGPLLSRSQVLKGPISPSLLPVQGQHVVVGL